MRPNTALDRLRTGGPLVNGWISSDSAYAAEALSWSGYDTVTVDLQHGMFDIGAAIRLLQAVSAGPAVPLARTDRLDAATIGKLLDGGAYGIICPAVETAAQARALVSACRYPPHGVRSFGPSRGLLYGGPDYVAEAEEHIMVWAMAESRVALGSVTAIAGTPGLTGVFVGPNDLALSLGVRPGGSLGAPVMDALRAIARAAEESGIHAGAFAPSAAFARELVALGYDFVTPGNDIGILKDAVAERIATVRGTTATTRSLGGY